MNNQEIKKALKDKRDIATFARFVGMSRQGLIKKLKSVKTQDCQYYNFILFILAKRNN